ncbi:multiple sugar transport system ATP-binding protein [Rhodococcus sp. 27YEA15]|uniref:ABC transporter ATP-binding protein n=1 Tax=Rhodococcus sp. 27YEA15 TaxID=3156259 RepID=UPI003C7AA39D
MSRIQLERVSKQFGSATAVHDVNLDIADGEFMVLLGPSGCGKSTLLRMIAGLESPSAGRISIGDLDITHTPPRARDVAMVFQSYALYPHLNVGKNIGFPLRARKMAKSDIRSRVAHVAELLGLQELLDRRPAALSGGQRQRVALARAMVREPGVFLMDEPLSNLDAKLRSATRTELIALHRRLGTTFVYVTHDQVEAMTMSTRIALLDNGTIAQVGTPTELYDAPRSTFVASFLGAPPMNLLDAEIVVRGGELHAVADGVNLFLGLRADTEGNERPVTVGIRPERIRALTNSETNPRSGTAQRHGRLRATVTGIENLGSEEVVHVRVGAATLCLRTPRPTPLRVGVQTPLVVDSRDVHLFDHESGKRLTWAASPSTRSIGHDAALSAS